MAERYPLPVGFGGPDWTAIAPTMRRRSVFVRSAAKLRGRNGYFCDDDFEENAHLPESVSATLP